MAKFAAVLTSTLAIFVLSCTSQNKTPAGSEASWPARMQGMARTLEKLTPYVFSREEFATAANRDEVRRLISDFAQSVEVVPKHVGEAMLGQDPLVKYSIQRLQFNTGHALKAFNEGHVDFARNILRENTGLCFSCHTTTQLGPENNFSTKALSANFRILPVERADYYVATRQFDRAIDVLEDFLRDPSDWQRSHEYSEALKKYLALQVRVKKEPGQAASTIERFLDHKNLPYFISADAEAWLRSLRDWKKHSDKADRLQLAEGVLKKAKSKQGQQGFQAAYVEYLRASALLHDALREHKDPLVKAKIYEKLGDAYEMLSASGTWDLPEVYYETCVRVAPKTPISQQCYKDFERSVILGFSGSAGIFIPREEKVRMAELKELAGLK